MWGGSQQGMWGQERIFFNERNNSSLFANGNDPEERAKLTVWERKE